MRYSCALEEQLAALRHVRAMLATASEDMLSEERLASMLDHGETYFWEKALCGVIEGAAGSLPQSWQWAPEMLPSREGFIWFDRPLATDTEQPLTALSWERCIAADTGAQAVNIGAFTPCTDHGARPMLTFQMQAGQSIFEQLAHQREWIGDDELHYASGALLIFGACLAFLEQRILFTSQQRAERHTRKRLERAGFEHEPVVRVVELRRKQAKAEHHGDSDPVEWSHQWIVSGHWRQQWYPSLNANQPRWIMPYVKGPDDKPLKPPRAKVFAVVR
jgi:hypothetical protein